MHKWRRRYARHSNLVRRYGRSLSERERRDVLYLSFSRCGSSLACRILRRSRRRTRCCCWRKAWEFADKCVGGWCRYVDTIAKNYVGESLHYRHVIFNRAIHPRASPLRRRRWSIHTMILYTRPLFIETNRHLLHIVILRDNCRRYKRFERYL